MVANNAVEMMAVAVDVLMENSPVVLAAHTTFGADERAPLGVQTTVSTQRALRGAQHRAAGTAYQVSPRRLEVILPCRRVAQLLVTLRADDILKHLFRISGVTQSRLL